MGCDSVSDLDKKELLNRIDAFLSIIRSEKLTKEIVSIQEPFDAYEFNLGAVAYLAGFAISFSAISVFYYLLPMVSLPMSIAIAIAGAGLMVSQKQLFRKEAKEAREETNAFK